MHFKEFYAVPLIHIWLKIYFESNFKDIKNVQKNASNIMRLSPENSNLLFRSINNFRARHLTFDRWQTPIEVWQISTSLNLSPNISRFFQFNIRNNFVVKRAWIFKVLVTTSKNFVYILVVLPFYMLELDLDYRLHW